MASRPKFTVIPGGTGSPTMARFIATGITDDKGIEYYRPSGTSRPAGGDGGGENPMTDIAGIKKNVGFLNWVAGLAAAAIVALYFILSGQIAESSKEANAKADQISNQVTNVRVEIAGQRADIKSILEKLDDQPKAGSRAR